ncbi:AAA family ATPase [Phaeobacter italicus]|uniref:AAA family ATPase n=1 Tax=Phaeobacter italicus TaxID=481446 RepID=UPI00233065D1|nr:AAA family ATPase [Phaeobacter italicus]
MRLTSIRLQNVRRFTDPVEINGIAPGLNLLSAPNEQGKSTIFDALHALFFKDAKSWDKDVRALAPHAGGDPEIEVTLSHRDVDYRVAKHFTKSAGKGSVRVWQGGTLLHQADAAEAWLRDLITPPKDDGPAAMLWVRQGLTDFSDAKETLGARRDLMSSLSGEIGAVTGGQQMESLRREIRAELDRLVTKQGRARANGPLAEAETRLAELTERRDTLAAQVRELRDQLDQRQALRREEAELQDPDEQRARQQRLDEAEAALTTAERHREKCEQATRGLDLARVRLDQAIGRIETLTERLADHARAKDAVQTTSTAQERAATTAQTATQELQLAEDAARAAQDRVTAAGKAVADALQAENARLSAGRRRELTAQLAEYDKLQTAMAADRRLAAQGPDAQCLTRLEQQAQAVALARHARAASAATLSVRYHAGADPVLTLDGTVLSDGAEVALTDTATLDVPGLAALTVQPARTGDSDALPQAESALAEALHAAGFDTLDAARDAHLTRSEAASRLKEAEATQRALAPDGREALVAKLDALPAAPADAEGTEADRSALEAEQAEAQQALTQAQATVTKARHSQASAQEAAQLARARAEAALAELERTAQVLGDNATARATLAELEADRPRLTEDVHSAQAELEGLLASAPDLDQARAAAQRARSVQATAQARLQDIARDLAVLDSRIETHASHAVEEELAEVQDLLAVQEKAHAAVTFEVATLQRLDQALEAAQDGAQAQYLGPLMGELAPLLRRLWPEAELQVDADSVLPRQLARGATEESLTQLSGGTQEQLALLVRLAFARLLAQSGQGIPVILDDALVYTDDARIEALFDALTLQASDLQILVFSCRQKSFRNLGGTALAIRPVDGG